VIAASGGLFIPGLIIGLLIGFLCMRSAGNFAGKYGRPPWGVPGWGWFVIGFILGVIGAILYGIAYLTSKKQPAQQSYYAPQAYPPPPTSQQSWQQQVGTPPPPPPGAPPPYPTSVQTGQSPPPVEPPPVEPPPVEPPPVEPQSSPPEDQNGAPPPG
jgi:hypothetical protein